MHALHRSLAGLALAASLLAAPAVHAQAAAPVDAEKQKLIDHILTLWHPENEVIVQVQRPATEAMQKSAIALQTSHVPKDKAEKTMKEIAVDVQKYVDTASPVASASAKKNVAPTVGPMLAQNFTVEELKQVVAMLESPVRGKFEKLSPQMGRAVFEKVQAEVGAEVDKDILAMNKAVGAKLQLAATVN